MPDQDNSPVTSWGGAARRLGSTSFSGVFGPVWLCLALALLLPFAFALPAGAAAPKGPDFSRALQFFTPPSEQKADPKPKSVSAPAQPAPPVLRPNIQGSAPAMPARELKENAPARAAAPQPESAGASSLGQAQSQTPSQLQPQVQAEASGQNPASKNLPPAPESSAQKTKSPASSRLGQAPSKSAPLQPGRLVVASRSLTHKNNFCSIMVNYPQLGSDRVDAELDFWARNMLRTFVSGVESLGPGNTRYSMMVDYELSEASSNVLSIIFRINTDMGGSDRDSGMVTFTYDLSDGRKLGMGDIFGDSHGLLLFLSMYSYENLTNRLGMRFEPRIKKGTSPDIMNFSLFALNKDGLTIFFPPYQVADASLGEQQVAVSLDELAPYAPAGGIWSGKSFLFGFAPKLQPYDTPIHPEPELK
ncbi:DUF3298 domain-containing protein [Desulfovibrio sp. OttesenSCG-928-C14]|nr:DUF3298 domain-containing protein [Desulfovibrio sp. OttesenSCG-928-C14]